MSSIAKDYCNQPVQWFKRNGTNEYNEPSFINMGTIYVRWESKRRLVRNERGEEVVSEASVLTFDDIKTGDKLAYEDEKEWPVIAVSETPDFDGNIVERVVSV